MLTQDLEVVGPLGVRRFSLARVCETSTNHAHNYDHDTIVISGRLQITVNGRVSEHGPGDVVFVPAEQAHELKALAPHTTYLCVFSHRDLEGRVSQAYVGNPSAYQVAGF